MSLAVVAGVDCSGVAALGFNCPDKANALNDAMLDAIAKHLRQWGSDSAVRAIVVRGAGRHFCAGTDVAAGARPQGSQAPDLFQVCCMLDEVPQPTVALVQGACLGSGMALAACCDVVIADRTAFFSIPEVRLGFTAGPLSLFFLRTLGTRQFRRYALSGQRLASEVAHRIGFVHELCDAGTLDAALAAQIEEILLAAPSAARAAKRMGTRLAGGGFAPSLVAQLQAEFQEQRNSIEALEGKRAFRDKRKPNWCEP
jgi:methylglutaconyl-CoA hydratase